MRFSTIALLVLVLSVQPTQGQESDQPTADDKLVTPAARKSIQRGLQALVAQQHDDGSFGSVAYRGNVAVSALAGMALVAGGNTPQRGPYGAEVGRTVDYLLSCTQPSGFIFYAESASHGPMYGHGFATLFLAECYGMAQQPPLREKLAGAVKLIVSTQNKEGGWRYQPRRADADISVTVCETMALRAARNAGLFVPNKTIDKATDYARRCQNADGGFMYMTTGGQSGFARSAAALVALNSAGIYEGPEIDKGLAYLMRFKPSKDLVGQQPYYFYGHYYAAQALWQAGGPPWSQWYPAVRDRLIQTQRPDGLWASSSICTEYATAMALLVLQMPENSLPIFQR